ncbi:PREDICTED: cytochrome b5-related protein-like isoform X1 [Atta colombica]|uniref:cytochrome b5-related protein-like isoform X1 n=1 Tax=Atta colombica TaxID=520822 RepID=UPI00084C375A|nr:PREDICTED: cytochrome b5-related protein-like isoform X1 [Atta colombica]XP_018057246.1 PREDICTED: cytochrome b5-related protein-like isoform X1 [Atta colombica]
MDKLKENTVDMLRCEVKKIFNMPKASTIPGLVYLSARDNPSKTAMGFINARKKIDGAEGLWRIENKLYDLENFMKSHPGGSEWIRITKGTDITELFEAHHITDKAERLLPKFYVREAATPRSVPLTFLPDGFYRTFKRRATEALKKVDFHKSSTTTNLITDSLVIATFALSLMAAFFHSYTILILASLFLTWTANAAHNYFHMRDNFRMYYFDLSMLSSKNFRITHAMSHHMYPNTIWDYEMYVLEPFVQWMPRKDKSYLMGMISKIISPIVWMLLYIAEGIKRYYLVYTEYGVFEFRDFIPFLLPISMSLVTPKILIALKLWLIMLLISSTLFGLIGFNAAHHHPDIFHDGDIYRNDLDWGLLELDAVRDRVDIDKSLFLIITNYGSHTLHHLLPTVDHHYLPLCVPAFLKTCEEFNVSSDKWTQWTLMKGQFRQIMRTEVKKNHR